MKLIGKRSLSGALEIVTWLLMAATVGTMASLYWIVEWMMNFNNNPAHWRPLYLVTLIVSGVFALLILWQVRGVLHNANNGTIFSMNTVKRMNLLGVESLLMSLFYVVMLFVGMTKFSVGLVALIFAFFGVIAVLFADLFVEAVNYKKENDMTI